MRGALPVFVLFLSLLWGSPGRALPPVQRPAMRATPASISLQAPTGERLWTRAWVGLRVVRMGGILGKTASDRRNRFNARVVAPLGMSVSLAPESGRMGALAVARGGMYVGAGDMFVYTGSWLGLGLGLRRALEQGGSLRVGLDVWRLYGRGRGRYMAPFVAYTF